MQVSGYNCSVCISWINLGSTSTLMTLLCIIKQRILETSPWGKSAKHSSSEHRSMKLNDKILDVSYSRNNINISHI